MAKERNKTVSPEELAKAKAIWRAAADSPEGLIIRRRTTGEASVLRIKLFDAKNQCMVEDPAFYSAVEHLTVRWQLDSGGKKTILHIAPKFDPFAGLESLIGEAPSVLPAEQVERLRMDKGAAVVSSDLEALEKRLGETLGMFGGLNGQ